MTSESVISSSYEGADNHEQREMLYSTKQKNDRIPGKFVPESVKCQIHDYKL